MNDREELGYSGGPRHIASPATRLVTHCYELSLIHIYALRLRFFKQKGKEQHSAEDLAALPEIKETPVPAEQGPVEQKGTILMKKVLIVDGMMCAHCQMHVQKALEGVDGVQEAVVDLEKKQATVSLSKEVSDQVLKMCIRDSLWMALQ